MNLVSGIVLNSLSSILSYNNFNFKQMLAEDTGCDVDNKSKPQWHEPTFTKQFIYFIIILSMNIGLVEMKQIIKYFSIICFQSHNFNNYEHNRAYGVDRCKWSAP